MDAFNFSPQQVRKIALNGFWCSFMPTRNYLEKKKYIAKIVEYYEKVSREFGIVVDPLEVTDSMRLDEMLK